MKEKTKNRYETSREANLSFEPGLTVIGGNANSGKTAIFRALQSLILNPGSAKHHITDGDKHSAVSLEIDGLPKINWLRTPSDSYYSIDGVNNSKCGRASLENICPEFLLLLEPDGTLVNFHRENAVLFPFGYGPKDLLKAFRWSFYSTAVLALKAPKQLNLSLRRTEITKTRTNISTRIKAVMDLYSMINSLADNASTLAASRISSTARNLASIITKKQNLSEILRILPTLISLSSFFQKEKDLEESKIYRGDKIREDLVMVSHHPLVVSKWEEPRPFSSDLDSVKIAEDLRADLGEATHNSLTISHWTDLQPSSPDYSIVSKAMDLRHDVAKINSAAQSFEGIGSLVPRSLNLDPVNATQAVTEAISTLRAIMGDLEGLKRSVASLSRFVTKLFRRHGKGTRAFMSFWCARKICPVV